MPFRGDKRIGGSRNGQGVSGDWRSLAQSGLGAGTARPGGNRGCGGSSDRVHSGRTDGRQIWRCPAAWAAPPRHGSRALRRDEACGRVDCGDSRGASEPVSVSQRQLRSTRGRARAPHGTRSRAADARDLGGVGTGSRAISRGEGEVSDLLVHMHRFRVGSLRSFLALLPIGFGACNSGGMVGSVDRSGTWSVVSVPTTDGLTNVRGSNSTNVWVAGDTTILRWDGHTWNRAPDPLPSAPAAGLWVNSSSDVWLGAGQKFAYHWMGSAWTSTSLNDNRTASAIWGSGPTDVGASGTIVHYDRNGWSQALTSPIRVPLHGIWGTAANDVWAVGEGGAILHFDGSHWSQSVSPTARILRSAWGSSSGDVWAVGDSGTVLHLTR